MTPRERWLETLLFGNPDRVFFEIGDARESTRRAWRDQGMAEDPSYMDQVQALVNQKRTKNGLNPTRFQSEQDPADPGVSFQMIPTFEEKVLEHKDGHYIVQDWMGAITEISDEFDYTYIRSPRDFVTRKWHKFPVENWDDWEKMKPRFNAKDPKRYAEDFEACCAKLKDRDYPFELNFNGPFWQLREFCGMEGLCMLMLTQPDLIRDMVAFWTDFCSETMKPILERVPPDMLHFSEDMAMKERPMISPEMTEQFLSPFYRRLIEEAKAVGTELCAIDSDGRIDLLIPLWMDCGVNCVDPIEVAAGNDIVAMREHFGKKLAYRGGIDKRAMAAGGDTLKAEMERIRPVVQDGGYLPSCDHGIPADVSWPNFQDYAVQLAEICGWL
jgi:hypothetical protein